MRHVVIKELAHGDGANPPAPLMARISLVRPVYGVAIGSDSELDICRVEIGGGGTQLSPWPGALIRSGIEGITGAFKATSRGLASEAVAYVGVGAAWVCSQGAPIRRELIVLPGRDALRTIPSGDLQAGSDAPKLTLDLAETPSEAEALLARIRRAPLHVPFSLSLGVTGAVSLYFPTYGRAWWSLDFNWSTVSGSGTTKAWQISGINAWAQRDGSGADGAPDSVGAVESSALASGSGTGNLAPSVEMDSAYDHIRLFLTATGGTTVGRVQGRLRAEDA